MVFRWNQQKLKDNSETEKLVTCVIDSFNSPGKLKPNL